MTTWKLRARLALRVIEGMAPDHCIGIKRHEKEECFACKVYGIAHSVTPCGQKHGWYEGLMNKFRELSKA